jgi:hypothetical protein
VWRIRDVYPRSRILIFTHPVSRISDPGSRISDPGSLISDPGSKDSNKREGLKKFVVITFSVATKFHKIANYFSFEVLKKKIWANFQRILELFTQKIVNKLSKIWWVWEPGSVIRKKPIPDPGSGIQGSKRHRIPDPGSGSATLLLDKKKNNGIF